MLYLAAFGTGIAGATVVCIAALAGFKRGYRSLVVRVIDLEDRFLSLKGRKAVNARWDAKEWMDSVATAEQRPLVQQPFRYDNDPK